MNCFLAARTVENWLRFRFRRIICRKNLIVNGLTLISRNCNIEIDRDARLTFNHKDRVETGTLIAARKGASIEFGNNVFINRNCVIVAHQEVSIGAGTQIGPNVCIYDHDHDIMNRGKTVSSPVNIGENVWIGAGSLIFKGVTIGSGSIIGGGSVITKDVPENSILVQKRQTLITQISKENKSDVIKKEGIDFVI